MFIVDKEQINIQSQFVVRKYKAWNYEICRYIFRINEFATGCKNCTTEYSIMESHTVKICELESKIIP